MIRYPNKGCLQMHSWGNWNLNNATLGRRPSTS